MADKGFLDSLGIGSVDERTILKRQLEASTPLPQQANLGARLGAGARPLFGAAVGGIHGLIANKGDRRGGFVRGMKEGATAITDIDAASAAGITPEQLRGRRKMREMAAQIPQDGTYTGRINAAKRMAKIAQSLGDTEVMGNALAMVSKLQTEKEAFEALQAKNDAAEYEQAVKEEVGYDARLITEDSKTNGKAVRIQEGPDAGRYLYINDKGERQVVDGGELVINGLTGTAPKSAKWKSLAELAKVNGAGPSKIPQLRAAMTDMVENSRIVTNIADILLSANDPQGVLAQSGKAAIKADKAISFAESLYYVFRPPGAEKSNDDIIHWEGENGKITRMTAQQQYEKATATGKGSILERWLSGQGKTLDDALPPGIRGNAIAAEQYWANVMQLAFIDARMHEPSNRGLSDRDIEAALQRIGAATANPVSFATRQIEVIEKQLLPKLDNLGNEFTTFDHDTYTKDDVINAVYEPTVRRQARDSLLNTVGVLKQVVARGRHGNDANFEMQGGVGEIVPTDLSVLGEELGLDLTP